MGMRRRKIKKYNVEAIWPMVTNGSSTGWPPIHVKIRVLAMKAQKKSLVIGRNMRLRCFDVWRMGIRNRITMEERRARTPPSLLGIERRMAYANRKYHSGLMCGGVTSGLAGVKLSGSPKRFGEKVDRAAKAPTIIENPKMSLYEKYE